LSADLINEINALLRKLHRFGYQDEISNIKDLMGKSSYKLFQQICRADHPLNHLLPPPRVCDCLHTRGHPYQLLDYTSDLHKHSFVTRSLYEFM